MRFILYNVWYSLECGLTITQPQYTWEKIL